RSVPLMMKVPLSVISGISPKKTSCSLISRTLFFCVSGSLEYTVRRIVTFRGAAYVIPRSWHSCMSYLSCRPTGSPHLLQNVTTFLLKVPQCWQRMSPAWKGSVRMVAPQLRHVDRRWCSPFRLPHLHSQLPIE